MTESQKKSAKVLILFFAGFVILLFIFTCVKQARGSILIEVVPSLAPNKNGSGTGWNAYSVSAAHSLLSNSGNVGDRNADPTAYEISTGSINAKEIIDSYVSPAFYSWRGQADPPEPFNKERGNRLHFGLRAIASGNDKILMDKFSYTIRSDDSAPIVFSASGSFASWPFSDSRIGVTYGANGQLGGGDDTLITSGNGPIEGVDALFYVGVGVGLQVGTTGTNSERLASAILPADAEAPFNIKATYTYTLTGENSTASVPLVAIPEPRGIMIFLMFLLVAVFRRNKIAIL